MTHNAQRQPGRAGAGKAALLKQISANHTGNSTANQRFRIMEALQYGPLSTIDAVRHLDIIRPGARISELRHKHGEEITTLWTSEVSEAGELHRVALYVLGVKEGV
jgi:hypothetical protein